jgi:hypothetical protein
MNVTLGMVLLMQAFTMKQLQSFSTISPYEYGFANDGDILEKNVVVTCYPFMALMNTLGHAHIDYFSLDVERVEMIILQSIDWDKLDGKITTSE